MSDKDPPGLGEEIGDDGFSALNRPTVPMLHRNTGVGAKALLACSQSLDERGIAVDFVKCGNVDVPQFRPMTDDEKKARCTLVGDSAGKCIEPACQPINVEQPGRD